jgi:hypothetical protein
MALPQLLRIHSVIFRRGLGAARQIYCLPPPRDAQLGAFLPQRFHVGSGQGRIMAGSAGWPFQLRSAGPAGFIPQSTIRNSSRLAQRAVLPLVMRARPSYAAAATRNISRHKDSLKCVQ